MSTIIRLQDIAARYDTPEGSKEVLHGVNLEVMDHDYLGVIGPNGGGKTTLMRLILGLKKPSGGSISYYHDCQQVESIAIGYLPQYSNIDRRFPISVREVVLSGLDSPHFLFHRFGKKEKAQVAETLNKMELESLADRPIGSLSGGQIQRVLLARAIVSRPDVLILDEPNTYIDKKFQAQMYEMLSRINQDCAIILVSHDIQAVLENAKHVACVNKTLHYHDSTNIPMEKLEKHFLNI